MCQNRVKGQILEEKPHSSMCAYVCMCAYEFELFKATDSTPLSRDLAAKY